MRPMLYWCWLLAVTGSAAAGASDPPAIPHSASQPSKGAVNTSAPTDGKPDPKVILDQVIHDILTNPDLKLTRDFYGTPGDRSAVLLMGSEVGWPRDWQPKVLGYRVVFRWTSNPFREFFSEHLPGSRRIFSEAHFRRPRLMGVRLYKFNLQPERKYDDQIAVSLFNVGGAGGETPVIGACLAWYTIKREGGKWVVKYEGSLDP